MTPPRIWVLHAARMGKAARINLLGVRTLLEQEGIPHKVSRVGDVRPAEGDVLIIADIDSFDAAERRRAVGLVRRHPTIWAGQLSTSARGLARALGVRVVATDQTHYLRIIALGRHSTTRPFTEPCERHLRIKHTPHAIMKPRDGGREIAALMLDDGWRLGAAAVARDGEVRAITFAVPLGSAFAIRTGLHIDARRDADVHDFPISATVDILRAWLRECIVWVAGRRPVARVYQWPAGEADADDAPTGALVLSHDLCGHPNGLARIRSIIEAAGATTTFFDIFPPRMKRGEPGRHAIALHLGDHSTADEFRASKETLEKRHGRTIRGWRRHGPTVAANYPAVWRNAEAAGILWGDTFPCQSHPSRSVCSPQPTSNRLPHRVIDTERGRRLRLLMLSVFDTDDADRLSNIHYGVKLPWPEFDRVVQARLDFAARHHLIAGYLLHGWTAAVRKDEGRSIGALDCQRMLRRSIDLARARGMMIIDCERLYDWWMLRGRVKIEPTEGGWTVRVPRSEFAPLIEIISGGRRRLIRVGQGRTRVSVSRARA